MKIIRRKMYLFMLLAGICAAAFIVIIFMNTTMVILYIKALAFAFGLLTVILAVTSINQYTIMRTAKLIVENQILHIQPAIIDNEIYNNSTSVPDHGIEVFISCFGILLDSKIIKFNQNNIRLKSVEIGSDFIALTYGNHKKSQKTRLLHAVIDRGKMADIVEKFRYETGVVTTIIN